MNQKQLFSENRIELHHEYVEEIMGKPPASMIRVGSGILLFVILGLFIGSRFIIYPDMLQATALIKGDLPLSIQTSPETGRVVHIFQSVNDHIEPGDTLLCIEKYTGEKFVIIAMVSGLLEINPLLNIKHYVQKSDTVAIIWGKKTESIACIIRLSPEQGKSVKEGNKLFLHLYKYPSKQYGVIESHVKSVSYFNSEKDIQVIAELPGKIITSNQHEIFIKGNNYASAEIITGEKTIFNRLVNPFRGLIK
jgi:hypothetical protein